jgi:hypothetical protein
MRSIKDIVEQIDVLRDKTKEERQRRGRDKTRGRDE